MVQLTGQRKLVYVALAVDVLDPRLLAIITDARALGDIVIGLVTDQVLATVGRQGSRRPYDQRKAILENVVGVVGILPQETVDSVANVCRLKPQYVFASGECGETALCATRESAIPLLREWGGEFIEPRVSLDSLQTAVRMHGEIGGAGRSAHLRRLIAAKGFGRFMEVHNAFSGLIVERARAARGPAVQEYDGMWLSSLTHSAARGKPDIAYIDVTSTLQTVHEIFDVTTKPLILDGDTGGPAEHLALTVKALERVGVSAIAIEDKVGLKRNSLLGRHPSQVQDEICNFAAKINAAKRAQRTVDFMILARIESLVLGRGVSDALQRAESYVAAGADGILIHSVAKDPLEVFSFCQEFRGFAPDTPLIALPTTYGTVTEEELAQAGVNLVIYSNHLLRSAYPAMCRTAEAILEYGRSHEVEPWCLPATDLIGLVPGAE